MSEKIYDEQIAPLMVQIIAICKEHNIPFVAQAELYDDAGEPVYCRTSLNTESAAMKMLHYLMISGNNFDLFAMKCMRDESLMKGHTSAILHRFTMRADTAGRDTP